MIKVNCPSCNHSFSVFKNSKLAVCPSCNCAFEVRGRNTRSDTPLIDQLPKAYSPENGIYEPFIFISYAHKDSAKAFPIIKGLLDNGFRVWYDAGIEVGSEWPEFIAEHIEKCTCFISLMSESAVASNNCRQEINFALSEKRDLLSIYLTDFKPPSGLRMQLGNFQAMYLFRFSSMVEFLKALCKAKILAPCRIAENKNNTTKAEKAPVEKKPSSPKTSYDELMSGEFGTNLTPESFEVERVAPEIIEEDENSVTECGALTNEGLKISDKYRLPSPDLLIRRDIKLDNLSIIEANNNKIRLRDCLFSLGIKATVFGTAIGPRVISYKIVPDDTSKIQSILNVREDIAINLALGPIRMMASISDNASIDVEISRSRPVDVRLGNLIQDLEFIDSESKTLVCLGCDAMSKPIFFDIAKNRNLLIAGSVGMGQTECVQSLLISLLYKASYDEVRFLIIETNGTKFSAFNGIPHMVVPVLTDISHAIGALMWAEEEAERRCSMISSLDVDTIDEYNQMVNADSSLGHTLPKIIIIIDVFSDLMIYADKTVEYLVANISSRASVAGIHMILSTRRPSKKVITEPIKSATPSRICFKASSSIDSETVLYSYSGAEKLLDRGDALYIPSIDYAPCRIQAPYISENEIEDVVSYIEKENGGYQYSSEIMEYIERKADEIKNSDKDSYVFSTYLNDPKFIEAIKLVLNIRRASVSLLQRNLSIGYDRAAKFIDVMEEMGIVDKANGYRPRHLILSKEEVYKKIKSYMSKTNRH